MRRWGYLLNQRFCDVIVGDKTMNSAPADEDNENKNSKRNANFSNGRSKVIKTLLQNTSKMQVIDLMQ